MDHVPETQLLGNSVLKYSTVEESYELGGKSFLHCLYGTLLSSQNPKWGKE